MEIREAVPNDAAGLLEHLRVLRAENLEVINPISSLPSLEEQKEYIHNLARDGGILLVCESGGAIIGILSCVQMKKRRKPTGTIGMSVTSPYRRMGIGMALLDRLIEEAIRRGLFEHLRLEVDSRNLAARRLYEKAGFEYVASGSSEDLLEMEYKMIPSEDRNEQ